MKHGTMKGHEKLFERSKEEALVHGAWTRKTTYDLASVLGIVERVESSVSRQNVFLEIKAKNRLYQLVDWFYAQLGRFGLQSLFLFLYMLKCAVSIGPLARAGARTVALENFPNEIRTVDRVLELVPHIPVRRISIGRHHILGPAQILGALHVFGCARRLLPFAAALARRHSFMPAARIASTLAFYIVFLRYFRQFPQVGAAIVTSNYSPEAAGMAAAAHRLGRRVVYANHAPVPWNGISVQPVLADCALFYGDMTRIAYQRRSQCTAQVALIGQPGISRAMQWRDAPATIGIFLTSGTRIEVLSELISTIRRNAPPIRILVRDHPVSLLKNDLSSIISQDPLVETSVNRPLDDDIAACDMVFCGNSGVTLNVLSGGRPVAYIDALDVVQFDYSGFVENGLVFPATGWSDTIYRDMQGFYKAPSWIAVMQSYNAAYASDPTRLEQKAVEILEPFLA